MIPLNAELFARAIVGAAGAYGDNPIVACTAAPGSNYRRSLAAATWGIFGVVGGQRGRICGPLGVSVDGSRVAKQRGGEKFRRAEQAAREAAAAWMRARSLTELARADAELIVPAAAVEPEAATPEPAEPAAAPLPAEPAPAPAPEPAAPKAAFTATAGAIGSYIRPPAFRRDPAATRGARQADRPVTDLVLEALERGPANSMSIASIIDRKEMAVSSALSQLAHEGLVASHEVENGPRRLVWALVREMAA